MTRLITCLDQVGAMRRMRPGGLPDPVAVAVLAELAGADGVSVCLRAEQSEEERDAKLLRSTITGRLQIRLSPNPESIRAVTPIRPDLIVLVPDRSDGPGTEAGFDLTMGASMLGEATTALGEAGLPVLALVEPEKEQVKAAHRLGVAGVALRGARLAQSLQQGGQESELEALSDCARLAKKLGLRVQVTQGIGLPTLRALASLTDIEAIEVGHALCARAMLVGMDQAVRDFRAAMAGQWG